MVTMATSLDTVTETNRTGRVVEEEEEGTSKEVEEEGTSNTIRITKATSNSSREALIEVVTKAIATTPEEILETTIEEEATTEGATSSGLTSDLRTWL